MKRFVAVIGDPNSGKSTIIQSLTGCKNKTFRGCVKDHASGTEIEVVASSPQEKTISKRRLTRMFRRAAQRPQSAGLIMAIQPNQPHTRICMEDLFALARQFNLSPYAFVLSPGYQTQPSKGQTKKVEDRLVGYTTRINIVNGKRFSHLNAAIIRDTVGFF